MCLGYSWWTPWTTPDSLFWQDNWGWGLSMPEKPTMGFEGWGFGPHEISLTSKENVCVCWGRWSWRWNSTTLAITQLIMPAQWNHNKNSGDQSWGELPGLAVFHMHVSTHQWQEGNTIPGDLRALNLGLSQSQILPYEFLPLAVIFFCYNKTAIINTVLSLVLWLVLVNYKTWGSPWESLNLQAAALKWG